MLKWSYVKRFRSSSLGRYLLFIIEFIAIAGFTRTDGTAALNLFSGPSATEGEV